MIGPPPIIIRFNVDAGDPDIGDIIVIDGNGGFISYLIVNISFVVNVAMLPLPT